MPAVLIRRLVLTGLFLTTFVTAGVLFSDTDATLSINVGEISPRIVDQSSNSAEIPVSTPSEPARGNAGLSWPFFSFRKGGR